MKTTKLFFLSLLSFLGSMLHAQVTFSSTNNTMVGWYQDPSSSLNYNPLPASNVYSTVGANFSNATGFLSLQSSTSNNWVNMINVSADLPTAKSSGKFIGATITPSQIVRISQINLGYVPNGGGNYTFNAIIFDPTDNSETTIYTGQSSTIASVPGTRPIVNVTTLKTLVPGVNYQFRMYPTGSGTKTFDNVELNVQTGSCPTGIPVPVLSGANYNNTASSVIIPSSSNTVDLSGITATNSDTNYPNISWHTGTPATAANKITNITALAEGTYYAASATSDGACFSNTISVCVGKDADGDAVPNLCDQDDDNDGILDTAECVPVNEEVLFVQPAGATNSITANLPSGKVVTFTAGAGQNIFIPLPSGALPNTSHFDNSTHTFLTASPLRSNRYGFTTIPNNGSLASATLTISGGTRVVKEVYLHLNSVDKANWQFLAANNPGISFKILSGNDYVNGSGNTVDLRVQDSDSQSGDFVLAAAESDTNFTDEKVNGTNGLSADLTILFKGDNITSLKFNFIGAPAITGDSNDEGQFAFEIKTLPDSDGDGIVNCLDLDSDNDGCLDAIEGGADITSSQLVNSAGTVSVGTGSTASNQNLCASATCVNTSGLPLLSPAPTGYNNNTGQSIGTSQNPLVNTCFCYETPTNLTSSVPVKHGITILGRAGSDNGNWPMLRNSAYTALEGKTKGFVVTRNSSPETTITNPVVGMMVFDTNEGATGCLKIYTGSAVGEGWKCFSTQGCP